MYQGFCIMNECNITQNRVKSEFGGYVVQYVSSDSYITCVNVVENNQSSGYFNHHSSEAFSTIFNVTSCNYIRNKSPEDRSFLMYSGRSDVFMSYCCIFKNEIEYIFYAESTITFENSITDSNKSYEHAIDPIFKNIDINECPLLNSIPTKDEFEAKENEEEKNNLINVYIKKIFHLTYFFSY